MIVKSEQQFLLAVLGNTLRTEGQKARVMPVHHLDWEYIRKQARFHRVGSLLFHACCKQPGRYEGIPSEAQQDFQEQYQQIYLRNTLLYQQLNSLLRQLAEIDIAPVLLKGIFLAKWAYGNIALRPMQDIDLLLEFQDIEQAERLLLDAGYTWILDHLTFVSDWHRAHETSLFARLHYQGYHAPTLIKTTGSFHVSVELHHHLTPMLDAQRVQTTDLSHAAIPVRTLQPEYFLLHLCFHLHSHAIAGKHPLLIWYYDLLKFLRAYTAHFDWALLFSLAERFQIQEIIITRLTEACRLFDYPLPAPLQSGGATAEELPQKCLTALFPERVPNPDRQFISSVFKMRTFPTAMRYLWECLFPSRKFLQQRYQIRSQYLVYGYYPLRLGKAVGRGVRLLTYLLENWWDKKRSGF